MVAKTSSPAEVPDAGTDVGTWVEFAGAERLILPALRLWKLE